MNPLFDKQAFEKRCLDNEELMKTILEGSMKDLAGHINGIKDSSALHDYRSLERSAHGLKGTSGTLSALQLHETAQKLELLAREAFRHRTEGETMPDEGVPASEAHIRDLVETASEQCDAFQRCIEKEFLTDGN